MPDGGEEMVRYDGDYSNVCQAKWMNETEDAPVPFILGTKELFKRVLIKLASLFRRYKKANSKKL